MTILTPTPFSYGEANSQGHNTHDQECNHDDDQIIEWGGEDQVPDWNLEGQFTESDYYDEESDTDSDEDNNPPTQQPALDPRIPSVAQVQQNISLLRDRLEQLEGEKDFALRCSFNGPPYRDASDEALMEWADLNQWLDEYDAKKEEVLSQVIEAEQELIRLAMMLEDQVGEVDMLDPRRVTGKGKYGEELLTGNQEEDLQRRFENVRHFARGIHSWGDENYRPFRP